MLTKCRECGEQMSDKAAFCPHCGCPPEGKKTPKRARKHDKLPNGFGEISRVSNCRLNPYRARNSNGKILGYYKTYGKAYEALSEYNRAPFNLDVSATSNELFEMWIKEKAKEVNDRYSKQLRSAWAFAKSIHSMKAADIRLKHIATIVEDDSLNAYVKQRLATIFKQMLAYGASHDIIGKNYADGYQMPKYISKEILSGRKGHIPFTDSELKKLWENVDKPDIDLIIIACYTGWRPNELLNIKKSDIDLKAGTMTGGSKTEAGKNRVVPIHSCVYKLVKERYGPKYQEKAMTYPQYYEFFKQVMEDLELNPSHKPHDTRVQFVTMAKKAGVNEYAIKRIVGHQIVDVTERVYTKRDDSWLKQEIEKIKPPAFLNCRNGVRTFQI